MVHRPVEHEVHPPNPEVASYHHTRTTPGWGRLPEDDYVRRAVDRGHRIPFKRRFQKQGFHQPCSGKMDQQNVMVRVVEASRKLKSQALVQTPCQDVDELVRRGHMITPTFMVDKTETTRMRMVHNQKRSNKGVRKKKPHFEDSRVVEQVATPGGKMFTCDVGSEILKGKDGYHMLWIAEEDQKFMTSDMGLLVHQASLGPPDRQAILQQTGVDIEGMDLEEVKDKYWRAVPRYVMCAALPYGYVNAPWLFQATMKKIAGVIRNHGVPGVTPIICSNYLDDWSFWAKDDVEAEAWQPIILKAFKDHGIMVQPGKGTVDKDGVWHIVSSVDSNIGVGINLAGQGTFFVPAKRQARIVQQAKAIRTSYDRHNGYVGALWIAQFAGLCMSTWLAVKQARFWTRPFFDDLVRGRAYQHDFHNQIRLNRESLRCLERWMRLATSKEVGRTIWRPPVDLPWTCDACTTAGQGWGAALPSQPLTGNPQQSLGLPAAGIWGPKHQGLSITALELKAVKKSLRRYRAWPRSGDWGDMSQGTMSLIYRRSLLLWEDNTGVVSILNNYATASAGMREDLKKIMDILEVEEAEQRVRYVASADNPADYFSRLPSKGEWVLAQSQADEWMNLFQPCTVDRFADGATARLPRFDSPYPCRGCEAVDTFTTTWAGECSWVNPPWRLLPKIAQRLRHEPDAAAVILAPHWPTQIWWPVLMSMAQAVLAVSVSEADVRPTSLAKQMGITPEITRRAGRAGNMVLIYVPARPPDVDL